jgi:superfamily II DNA/RNA helicase
MSRSPRRAPRRSSSASRSTAPAVRTGAPAAAEPAPLVTTPGAEPVEDFAALDLPPALLPALAAQGVTAPFPIQAASLPNSLAGRDVLGRGRTGSGKTLAFGLALLARLDGRRATPGAPLALVLVPTRELAQQVTAALTPYAAALGLRVATVVGGLSINRQAAELRRGAEVVVATPGRLNDLVGQGSCTLGEVAVTVLDEADQMADMGFLPQITKLVDQVPRGGQHLLFSATLDRSVDRLVRRFLTDPVVVSVDPAAGAVTTMEHHVLHVRDETDKKAVTARIAARDGRVILFIGTKRAADRLTKRLLNAGVRAAALHGGRSQPQRDRTLAQFKDGQVTALVATNVAARGIHVDDLDLVVNVDPPADPKDYLHRGGRTARAGGSGSVVTLVLPDQRREVVRLMADAGITPRTTRVASTDPELAELTGAREPSGIPVTIPVPAPRTPAKSAKSRKSSGTSGAGKAPGRRRRGARTASPESGRHTRGTTASSAPAASTARTDDKGAAAGNKRVRTAGAPRAEDRSSRGGGTRTRAAASRTGRSGAARTAGGRSANTRTATGRSGAARS